MFNKKLVYIHSQTPNYVRVYKCLKLFSRLFYEVHYIGCSRGEPWTRASDSPNVHYHIYPKRLPHGPSSSLPMMGLYHFVKKSLEKIAPDVVIATNEDFIIPFLFRYVRKPRYLVCDLIDSLAIRISSPLHIFNPILRVLSRLSLAKIDALIEVNEERLALHKRLPRLHTIIYNSPPWIEKIDHYPGLISPAIYVGGSIVDKRSGIETLIKAVELVPDMKIIFAGRHAGAWLDKVFLHHPKVKYLGEVTPEDSLRIAKACKAIFAHYEPSIPNFIYAAPNKLFDAMMLGVPILMNSECQAGTIARENGFGLFSPYGDVLALKINLERLMRSDPDLEENCRQARYQFRDFYAWERMEERYVSLFRTLFLT